MLITGGAGFIGVNAASHFLKQGWTVTLFDNFSRRGTEVNRAFLESQGFGDRLRIVRGDVRTDSDSLKELIATQEAVIHLAAQVAVTTSVADPRDDFMTNALGTFNVLEAVRAAPARPILLYASTNKVYGSLEDVAVREEAQRYVFADGRSGVTEEQPLDFHSPYGCSKGSADQYVRDFARLYGMRTVVFRQSCIYGPRQMGVEDQGWVAWFLIAGLLKRPLQIYGNGKQVRDLLFVGDLVECYERAIEGIDSIAGSIFNLGGGAANTLSLLEFLDLLQKEFGMDLSYAFSSVRPGDQPIFVSDNAKAARLLDWQPRTALLPGIHQLHAWLSANLSDLQRFYPSPAGKLKCKVS